MHAIPDSLCYLNGEFGPLAQARVSVLDRGFLFGDGVYEAMPVYGKRIFRFEEHMARLGRSLAKVRIANPHTTAEWLAMCRELITAHEADNQLVYLQVTRGVAPRDHGVVKDHRRSALDGSRYPCSAAKHLHNVEMQRRPDSSARC